MGLLVSEGFEWRAGLTMNGAQMEDNGLILAGPLTNAANGRNRVSGRCGHMCWIMLGLAVGTVSR